MGLAEETKRMLEHEGYDWCGYRGCFTLAAGKRKSLLMIKLLPNVDSFQEHHADDLRVLARRTGAEIVVVGATTRRGALERGTVYERFGVPVVSGRTLEDVITNDAPLHAAARGGVVIAIDAALLRERRLRAGMSQSELAKKLRVNKKTIYEHERANKNAFVELAERMEHLLGAVSIPARLEPRGETPAMQPRAPFETAVSHHLTRLGLTTSFVRNAPFNIIAGDDDLLLFSEAEADIARTRRAAGVLARFARVVRRPVMIVADSERFDVPTVTERELRNMNRAALRRLL